jgi:hypothetical protein
VKIMTKKNWMLPFAATALAGLMALPAQAADEAAYKAACDAAEASRKAAAEARYEWNTTAKLIKKAGEAAANGDFGKAVKLCGEAQKQGELALAQAKRESEDWKAEAALVK